VEVELVFAFVSLTSSFGKLFCIDVVMDRL
jgi:hypothetical protein